MIQYEDATVRLGSCQRAAEKGEDLNDAWQARLKDHAAGPAQRVNELHDERVGLVVACRGGGPEA